MRPHDPPSTWVENGRIDATTVNLISELLRRSASNCRSPHAALWLANEDYLVPVVGVGPLASRFVGRFSQPLNEGLVSLVHASGQAICENTISRSAQHSPKLDDELGYETDAMVALPVNVLGDPAGVLTCVHNHRTGERAPSKSFDSRDVAEFDFAVGCISRLIEASILTP